MMENNPLRSIHDFGQSIWQDDIRRKMIYSGELKGLIEKDGISGVTSNPSIFEKAIAHSRDYDDDIRALALLGRSTDEIYENLTVRDVQMAADLFRPLYDRSNGRHGFVSLEVNPHLARDAEGTIAEAHRLWKALDRPNVMIKVPATREGLACIRRLIGEGLNVNVTLLFGLPRYREVAEAFIGGLEDRAAAKKPVDHIASVASFFLSRIDIWIDPLLKKMIAKEAAHADIAQQVYGQVAIASAKKAYQIYQEIFEGERFAALARRGARPQRLLWASTSTKEPEFSDVKYVEALIGPDTVNTLPRETIAAYRDHGRPAGRLTQDVEVAGEVLENLAKVDIDIDKVTRGLVEQGIEKFNQPYDSLIETLEKARLAALREPIDRQAIEAGAYDGEIKQRIADLHRQSFNERLWRRDASLWEEDPGKQASISGGLGWLDVGAAMQTRLDELAALRDELIDAGFTHVVHMGMGGSSLAPLVFQRSFAAAAKGLRLSVLDTTDPATLLDCERRVPLERTVFIVASKSGTTAEPLAFGDYFYDRLQQIKGEAAGENFIAVTDPGTPLVDQARERRYRRIFLNFTDIGGRYSALSYFGMLPAALMGLDIGELMVRAERMMHACAADKPAQQSPGVVLGAALGELARRGRDKITFINPPALDTLGMWLEQLLAESTGKEGTGLLPVAGEAVGPPSHYGDDRVFVYFSLDNEPDERLDRSAQALREAGQPLISIRLQDRQDVTQEFFRWEIATATAGAVLGINAFDQPNVQESKDNTNRLLTHFREKGRLPEQTPSLVEDPLSVYLAEDSVGGPLAQVLSRFFRQAGQGDYIAILAYLSETSAIETLLRHMRLRLRRKLHAAVTSGYGPRYLHSTGQLHKGGPDTGLFLQLTADDARDADIPGKPYSFGILKKAQAQGDLEALHRHGRRAMRIHLGADATQGLDRLQAVVDQALAEIG
jgi:transaldolase/glucose-6-phosphate isomerase